MTCISNCIHVKKWCVITHICLNFNGGLVKPPLKFGHGWVITHYAIPWCYLLMHVLITHWGRVTHICVGKLTNIGSDNGLSPGRRQAIIWTNAGILLIGPLWTNFSEISIESITFSFKKMHLKMSSGKWRAFFLGLNVIIQWCLPGMTSTHRVMNAQFLTPRGVVHCSRNGALRWLFHSLLAQP